MQVMQVQNKMWPPALTTCEASRPAAAAPLGQSHPPAVVLLRLAVLCVLVPAALMVCLPAVAAMLLHMPTTWACVHYLGFAGAGWAVIIMRTVHLLFTAGEPAREQVSVIREQTLLVFHLFWNAFMGVLKFPWDAVACEGNVSARLAAFELPVQSVVIQYA